MLETLSLKADLRENMGTKHATRLRAQGKLPAIVYGHGQEPVGITINTHDFVEGLHHGHRIIEVQLPGGNETLLVKDLQYDHLGKNVIHADMVRVNLNERVVVTIPIELRGTSKGSHEGGIIDESLDHLEVECVVSDIPETIPVSVKELGIGDAVHAKDVVLPEGMVLKTESEAILCVCHLPKAKAMVEEEEEVEVLEEPEVITERVGEEEQAESPE